MVMVMLDGMMGPSVSAAPTSAVEKAAPYPERVIVGIRTTPVAAASALPDPDTTDMTDLDQGGDVAKAPWKRPTSTLYELDKR